MPRRRRMKLPPRIALPGSELESKIMAMLRGLKECAKLKGVGFVHVGSFGQEPNSASDSHLRGLQTSVRYCSRQGA